MSNLEHFTVKIDQLPEETVEAVSAEIAASMVRTIIMERESLRRLHDDEPVQIKRPDRTPWGRNLTIGDFRKGPVQGPDDGGPIRPPNP